jgi:hypothetical protein
VSDTVSAIAAVGLGHRRDMFAPGPPSTRDELRVRAGDGDAPLRPDSARWRKYLEHVVRDGDARAVVRQLCRTTGAHRVALHRLVHRIPAPGQPATPPEPRPIADLPCAPSPTPHALASADRP